MAPKHARGWQTVRHAVWVAVFLAPGLLSPPPTLALPPTSMDRKLNQALREADVAALRTRMQEIAEEDPPRALELLPQLVGRLDRSDEGEFGAGEHYHIFVAAAGALGRIRSSHAEKLFLDALRAAATGVGRLVILQGALRNPEVDALLLAREGLEDPEPLVVVLAARTLGNSRKIEPISHLVAAMARWEGPGRSPEATGNRKQISATDAGKAWLACRDALHKLTGKSLGRARDYENYVAAHRDSLDPTAVDLTKPGEASTGVGLFGLEVTGKNIVFLLDVSGSMLASDPPPPDALKRYRTLTPGAREELLNALMESRRRIVRARTELISVIQALGEDRTFNIVVFGSQVGAWQKQLVTPTKEAKKEAEAFIAGIEPAGVTYTDEALRQGFDDPFVDTVYLITDGAPTHVGGSSTEMPPDSERLMTEILAETRIANHLRNVRIFTLGFEGAREDWLRQLSRENHGEYRRIP